MLTFVVGLGQRGAERRRGAAEERPTYPASRKVRQQKQQQQQQRGQQRRVGAELRLAGMKQGLRGGVEEGRGREGEQVVGRGVEGGLGYEARRLCPPGGGAGAWAGAGWSADTDGPLGAIAKACTPCKVHEKRSSPCLRVLPRVPPSACGGLVGWLVVKPRGGAVVGVEGEGRREERGGVRLVTRSGPGHESARRPAGEAFSLPHPPVLTSSPTAASPSPA